MSRSRFLCTKILLGLILFVTSTVSSPVHAIETTNTNFLLDPPVQISAYGWRLTDPSNVLSANNPLVIQYIQLYNDSDELVDVSSWRLYLQDILGTRTPLTFSGTHRGWLEPHKHVSAGYAGSVNGATYSLEMNALPSLTQTVKPKLILTPIVDGTYKEVEHELKSTAAYWQRNTSSTGEGYVSTFTGVNTPPSQLADDGLYGIPENPQLEVDEIYPYSSDCPPNDKAVLCGDYIKLHVYNTAQDLSQYMLRTDSNSSSATSSNTFNLADYAISPDGYITVTQDQEGERISLTNSGGYIWIEDLYGKMIYQSTMTKYESATSEHQGWSWILGVDRLGQWSYTPQPYLPNKLTMPPAQVETAVSCPAGKYLNPDTNRCRTIEEAVNALAACPEGQERNPVTNRCRAKVAAAVSTPMPCGEGQERNPATNRCRSIASAVAEQIPCDEGYERNPATNRCRKVLAAETTGSIARQLVEEAKANGVDMWTWALVGVGASGAIGYGFYEWRSELASFGKKVVAKLGKK